LGFATFMAEAGVFRKKRSARTARLHITSLGNWLRTLPCFYQTNYVWVRFSTGDLN